MKLLLDTHVLLWLFTDETKLAPAIRTMLADAANEIIVSVVSLWEIVVKVRAGKLEADLPAIMDEIAYNGFTRLTLADAHLTQLVALPSHHRDPFDHLLIAQAIAEDATLVTLDRAIARYPVKLAQ